jgi:hypothetical protein
MTLLPLDDCLYAISLKDATVKAYHYDDHAQLRSHLDSFLNAYHFAKHLNSLRGLTPFPFICSSFRKSPHLFTLNPFLLSPGLYS